MLKRESAKRVWLITYGTACPSITHEVCTEGGVEVDECYTLTERDFKYTLIHTVMRKTLTKMQKMMEKAESAHGIKVSNLFGYEPISANDTGLRDHPGMNLIIRSMYNPEKILDAWLATGDLTSNAKGLLYTYVTKDDVDQMTKTQLQNLVVVLRNKDRKAQKRLLEYGETIIALDKRAKSLAEDNKRLNTIIKYQDELEMALLGITPSPQYTPPLSLENNPEYTPPTSPLYTPPSSEEYARTPSPEP